MAGSKCWILGLQRCWDRHPHRSRVHSITVPKATFKGRLAWLPALVMFAIVPAIAIMWALRPTATPPEMRVDITTPSTTEWTTDLMSFAISPDGRRLVFVASGDGQSRIWLRTLDYVTAQPLA